MAATRTGKSPGKKAPAAKAPAKRSPAKGRPRKKPAETLTAGERVVRDKLIAVRAGAKVPWADIGREVGLTVRQCQRIAERESKRANSDLLNRDPVQLVEELLREFEDSATMYLAAAASAKHTAEMVGALRGRDQALLNIATLLQATGTWPRDLSKLRHVFDLRAIGTRMLDAMERFEKGDVSAEEVTAVFRELTGLGSRAPTEAA